MRIRTTETTLYTYDELSDDAKERVREWWNRVQWDDGSAAESMQMIWSGQLEEDGWVNLSNLTFDLYSQGGYPAWTGTREGWEHDGHRWTVSTVNRRYMDVDVEPEDDDVTPDQEKAARDSANDYVQGISHDLFWKFRAEDDYMGSDEQVREACEANEYEFTEDGTIA